MAQPNAEMPRYDSRAEKVDRIAGLVGGERREGPERIRLEISREVDAVTERIQGASVRTLSGKSGETLFALALAAKGADIGSVLSSTGNEAGATVETEVSSEPLTAVEPVLNTGTDSGAVETGYATALSEFESTRFSEPYLKQAERFLAETEGLNDEELRQALEDYSIKMAGQYETAKNSGASEDELNLIVKIFIAAYRARIGRLEADTAINIGLMLEKTHGE